ncbi:MAG: hypothetical protein HC781_21930 [Leptolyngbyaceae cyanobacterium CSU_1_4]|nr:hypothetical protein [Leptolyngbyaceae cyanobacterium CSU_1_4]
MTLSDIRKYMEQHPSPTLRKLRSSPYAYKLPKGYASWDTLSAIAALCVDGEPKKDLHLDPAANTHRLAWKWWVEDNLPTYCLSNELLRDFELTDIDGLAKLLDDSWIAPLPGMLLLLPNSSICTADGQPVPYVLVMVSDGKNKTPFQTEHSRQISLFFSDQSEATWVTGFGLGTGKILFRPNNKLGTEAIALEDEIFLANMRSIVLQTVLALSYLPELIDADEPDATPNAPIGFGKKEHDRPSYRFPRWVGKNYQRQKSNIPSGKSRGTHVSPETHWRRGHWRLQSHGVGMKERKLIRIKPMLISG